MAETKERVLPPLWVLTALGVALCFWLVLALKEIVALLVVGYCIAYVFDPVLDRLEQRKIPRAFGVFLVLFSLFIVFTLLILTALPTLLKEYQQLSENLPQYLKELRSEWLPFFNQFEAYLPEGVRHGSLSETLVAVLPGIDSATIKELVSGLGKTLLRGYSVTLTLVNLALLPFIVFYCAVGIDSFHT
ncbi:MAG: AI-2E family transporter, partial [Bdellovibrionales bacterium]|nr:AI-2E family transporter [Bdellovibrionales bacterium]